MPVGRHVRVQADGFEQGPDRVPRAVERRVRQAVDADRAGIGCGQAEEDAGKSRLPRPVRPHEAGHPARFDVEGHVVEHRAAIVVFRNV